MDRLHEPTIFLVDDDDAVRQSLALLIATYGLQVESCASAEQFLERWDPDAVGCLVLDIRMAGMSGLALQELLQERGITMPIVFITGHGDINACRRAFQGGAVDFLTKPVDEQALMDSIRKGISQDIRQRHAASEILHLRTRFAQLSDRERQVLELILDGLPNKLIAREIGLSTRTVESHRSRIYLKLGANSLAQLVRSVMKLEDSGTREAAPPHADAPWAAALRV
ncbi:MAG TPA: response regulator [Moraxellaceae bacterium]|nr:response regulator [Moraxellaceae bacterium]